MDAETVVCNDPSSRRTLDRSSAPSHLLRKAHLFPPFNLSGVIPPFKSEPTDPDGSPYQTDLCTLVEQLGTSEERRRILNGLLEYRAALRTLGVTAGFQLIDGSFTEDCERQHGRPPSDIDLVTYAYLPVPPSGVAGFQAAYPNLFQSRLSKHWFHCDAYFVDLSKSAELLLDDTFYWYGLFSHQKVTATWKGILRIPLMADDEAAGRLLTQRMEADHGS